MKGLSKKPLLTLDASIVQDDVPLQVIPKVFVGSIHAAFNLDELQNKGITHILNASRIPVTFPNQFTYLSVEIRDKDDSNILACIPTTNIFIEAGLDHGAILVHCFGGKSRSPAFIAAYIMSSRSWSFDQAYSVIKTARPAVEINMGFECQLRAYHAGKFDVYLAQQILLRTRIRELHYLKETSSSSDQNNTSNTTATSSTNNVNVHEIIAAHLLPPSTSISNTLSGNGAAVMSAGNNNPITGAESMFKGIGLHDSFTCAPRDANGNILSGSMVVNNNAMMSAMAQPQPQPHRHKRSFSDAKEMSLDVPSSDTPPPMTLGSAGHNVGEDDMEVVTDMEESVSSFRSPPSKSNASSHHSNFSKHVSLASQNSSVISGVEPFEESMDSAVTAMSTDQIHSRPSSSSSLHKRPLLTVVNPGGGVHGSLSHQKSDFSLHNNNVNNSSNTSMMLEPPVAYPHTFQQPALPSFLGIGRSMSNKHSNSSSSSGGGGGGFSTRRSKQPRSSAVPATPSSAGLPQSITPEIGTKNPSCHLSRPGSKWIRVIPPLRGLEREFKCSWCNTTLFQLGNVLRIDLNNLNEMLETFYQSLEVMSQQHQNQSSSSSSGAYDMQGKTEDDYLNAHSISTNTNNAPFIPPQTMRGGGGSLSKQSSFKFYDNVVMNEHAHDIMLSPRTKNATTNSAQPGAQFKPNSLLPPIGANKGPANHTAPLFGGLGVDDVIENHSPSFEMDVEQTIPTSQPFASSSNNNNAPSHSHQNLNTIHFSSSFKHSNNSSANSFNFDTHDFPMPMSTSKAAMSKGKGFNFDMVPFDAPNPTTSNTTTTAAGGGVGMNSMISPRNSSSHSNGGGSGITPRRLPALDPPTATFTSQSTDSPRMSGPAPPSIKRQSSAGSGSLTSLNHSQSTSQKLIPVLPSRKHLVPPTTSLGPPYPNTVIGYDESPRLMIPPHRQQQILQQQGVVNSTDYTQLVSSNDVSIYNVIVDRPKSAEKRRWLARMNLLQEKESQMIASMAEADDVASQVALNGGKYYYIEYMDWMGRDLFSNHPNANAGDVICPGCKNAVGHWTWTPSQRLLLDGRLEAPLFRIHKHVVHHTEFDFDATPSSTPRPPDDINNTPV